MSDEEFNGPDTPESWDEYFLGIATLIASRSKDPSTKVGAIVVGPGGEIVTTGYNGFARGVMDSGRAVQGSMNPDGTATGLEVVDFGERWRRPEKYDWVVHAEHNCVLNAARIGVSLVDCVMYVCWSGAPCMDCCKAIIQSGIKEVVMGPEDFPGKGQGTYYHIEDRAKTMLREAGVRLRQL